MIPAISIETLFSFVLQFLGALTTFAILWRTLNGKIDKERKDQELLRAQTTAQLEKERKEQEALNAQAAIAATKEANEQVRKQNLEEIKRLDGKNADLEQRLGSTADACDKRIEALMTEVGKLRNDLYDTRMEKAKAEAVSAAVQAAVGVAPAAPKTAPAAPAAASSGTGSGQVAEGTVEIKLDVKPKEE